MVNSIYTDHAIKRIQQRTSKDAVECLIEYGQEYKCTGGTSRYQFDSEAWLDASNDGVYAKQILEKARNLYVVCSDGLVITVAHRTKRTQNKFKRK